MPTPFFCFYCGDLRAASERSDEHIIPSCMGGSRNGTLTRDVCAACNQRIGDEVDRPFGRDWVVATMRLIAGVHHRGKPPIASWGELQWTRRERVEIVFLEAGVQVAKFDCVDESEAIAVIVPEGSPLAAETLARALDTRFRGMRIINRAGGFPLRRYDAELLEAFEQLGPTAMVRRAFDLHAWDRAIAKMGLGLACMTLGEDFVRSPAADRLRAFLREPDPARRDAMDLRGRSGAVAGRVLATVPLHPGGAVHLFMLTVTPGGLGFVANLFGQYENQLLLDDAAQFADRLPATQAGIGGLAWVVDPVRKATRGPVAISDLILGAVHRGEPV